MYSDYVVSVALLIKKKVSFDANGFEAILICLAMKKPKETSNEK